MSITFYNMHACGFCQQAKKMFAAEIESGEMIVKPSSEAPPDVKGFPTFVAKNGTKHSGLTKTKQELYSKLGVSKEKYMREYDDTTPVIPIPTNFTKLYINPSPPLNATTNYVYIPFQKSNTDNITGVLVGLDKPLLYNYLVYSNMDTTPPGQRVSITATSIQTPTVVYPQDIEKVLLKLFPCTSVDDWNAIFQGGDMKNIQSLLPKLLPKLLPPQPCKSDNSVYCCTGKDAPLCFCKPCPKHHFFDMKTVAMICFILLLLLVLLYMIMSKDKNSGSSGSNSR